VIPKAALVATSPGSDRFWQTLWSSVRAIVGSIIGSKDLLGPHLSLLRPLELALLRSQQPTTLTSSKLAKFRSRLGPSTRVL
jgi:hypothetical protein